MTSSLNLKRIGIWTGNFEPQPASKVKEAVAELEQLGYGAVWFGEALGRESLTQAGLLLSASSHIVAATGITNIYGRDPVMTNKKRGVTAHPFGKLRARL
jgi:alkanesulfonate monooxygenase SsuD/methylene tetrahydromethanopterin reductase-like flavin-dependent oxidoreductase (luciferase family)